MFLPDHLSRRRGLTLIEVMVALGVLVILVSGIFMVVQTSLKTVLLVDTHASREDEITNLTDILRTGFRNLPSRARMTVEPITTRGVKEILFTVRDAPGFLTWLSVPGPENEIVLLSLRQDSANGHWRVCVKRFTPPASFSEKEFHPTPILKAAAAIPWLELVAKIERVGVRFFDGHQWKETWKDPEVRPALVELTLIYEHPKDPRSSAAIFWIPPVKGART